MVELFREQGMAQGTITLSRRAIGETQFGYLADVPADVFSQEMVRNVYGGGDYIAQGKKADRTFAGRFTFKIDYSIPAKYPGAEKKAAEQREDRTPEIINAVTAAVQKSLPPPAPPQDNTLLLALLAQQQAQQAQQGELMKALLLQRAQAPDPALAELRAELRALKDAAGNKGPGQSLASQIKDYIALQEIIGGGAGNGGGDSEEKPDRLMQLATALAPALLPGLAKLLGGGAAAAPQPVQAIQPAIAAATSEPVLPAGARPSAEAKPIIPTPNDSDPMTNPLVALYLSRFRSLAIKAAAKGQSAADWVGFMLDSLPDDAEKKLLRQIFTLANAEDWFAKIFAADAAATRHMQWLLDMRNAVLTHAFVFQMTANYHSAPPVEPEAAARGFLGTVSPSYLDTLYDLTDPEAWADTFKDSGIDGVWLEKLRVVFEQELGEEEPAAEAKPASAPAGTGEAAGEPVKVSPTAPPKTARRQPKAE